MARKPTYEELEQRIRELEEESAKRKRAEEALREKTYELGEGVKALNCLYAFSNLIERPDISLPEIFQGIVDIIPSGWQYPEVACARLIFEDKVCTTGNFMETIWKQSSPILVDGKRKGTLEVYYLEEKPECEEGPFLNGERDLLDAIAGRLGKVIQRRRAEEQLSLRNKIERVFLTVHYDDMYGEVLQIILEAMESKYGIFGYIDEHGTLIIPSLTRDIWEKCQVSDKRIEFSPETWGGIWGRSLIEKRSLFANEGLRVPKGHIPITKVLVTPIIYHGEVIGLLEVGNKATDYEEKDKDFLETIASHIAPILRARLQRDFQERKRRQAEELLRRSLEELEIRVQERTAELTKANEALRAKIAEHRRAEKALRESENRLRLLSFQLLTIQERERKRVAQELHDGIGQRLAAIKFRVENAMQQQGKRKIKAKGEFIELIIPMIQESVEEVRRIQLDLRPPILDDLGILAVIGWFCREFQKVYPAIRIEKGIEIQEDEVSVPLKTIMYRVMQEAMNNVAKHSQANLVRLSLKKSRNRIEFVIEDNGIGFDLEKSKTGFGVGSMKERIEQSDGTFTVESIKGRGTVIHASWPIKYL
jgi:signal transduction histidine kinase